MAQTTFSKAKNILCMAILTLLNQLTKINVSGIPFKNNTPTKLSLIPVSGKEKSIFAVPRYQKSSCTYNR